jgi:hypothetical protein
MRGRHSGQVGGKPSSPFLKSCLDDLAGECLNGIAVWLGAVASAESKPQHCSIQPFNSPDGPHTTRISLRKGRDTHDDMGPKAMRRYRATLARSPCPS